MNLDEAPELHTGVIVSKYSSNHVKVREEWTDREYMSLEEYEYYVGDKVVFFLEQRKVGPVVVILHKQDEKSKSDKDMSGWI